MLATYDKGKNKDDNAVSAAVDEDTCIICLQRIRDRTILPKCSHDSQCFNCFVEWAKYSQKCPLCVSDVGPYIIHNVRSKHDYEKHYISPPRSQEDLDQILSVQASRVQSSSLVRRRKRAEEPEEPDILEGAIIRRRYIYRNGLYAKHVASNRYTQYLPYPTPNQVSNSVELQRKATAFLRRELRVWINLDVEFLTSYIITLIKMLDLRSEAGIKLLSELLDPTVSYTVEGRKPNTEHLAHELYGFLRSPYKSLEDYDAVVQYDESLNINMRDLSSSQRQPVTLNRSAPGPSSLRYSSRKQSHPYSREDEDDDDRHYGCSSLHRRHYNHNDHYSGLNRTSSRLQRPKEDVQSSSLLSSNGPSSVQYTQSASSLAKVESLDQEHGNESQVHAEVEGDSKCNNDSTLDLEREVLMECIRRNMANNANSNTDTNMNGDFTTGAEVSNSKYRIEDKKRQELLDKIKAEKSILDSSRASEEEEGQEIQDMGQEREALQKQDEGKGLGGQIEISIRGAAARAKVLALQEAEVRLRRKALLQIRLSREKALAASTIHLEAQKDTIYPNSGITGRETQRRDYEKTTSDTVPPFTARSTIDTPTVSTALTTIIADVTVSPNQENKRHILHEKLLKERLLLQRLNSAY